jgi:H+/gluconate symporter-like permease
MKRKGGVNSYNQALPSVVKRCGIGLFPSLLFVCFTSHSSLLPTTPHYHNYTSLSRNLMAAFIVGAKRTAFGAFGGKLLKKSATQLGAIAANAALRQAQLNPELGMFCAALSFSLALLLMNRTRQWTR